MQNFLEKINECSGYVADFILRQPGIDVAVEREEAMLRLRNDHLFHVLALGFSEENFWRAAQVHGANVAVVDSSPRTLAADGLLHVPEVDGIISNKSNVMLGIYVADCGAIWLLDKKTGAYGLLHSGKKGTELNILGNALSLMEKNYGTNPSDVLAILSPCIRPPEYEVDFAAEIARQAQAAGVGEFYDCGICTASDLSNFYSYRKESGRTGRMLALLGKR